MNDRTAGRWIATVVVCLGLAPGCGDGSRTLESRFPDGTLKEQRRAIVGPQGDWINHGPFKTFYPGGKSVLEEGSYVNGHLHGTVTHFYESGAKKAEGLWQDGRLVGKWKYWDREGNPIDALPEEDTYYY